jgi:excisionase family DNA binding protein
MKLTVSTAAAELGVSRVAIYDMTKRGRLAFERVNGVVMIDAADIETQKAIRRAKKSSARPASEMPTNDKAAALYEVYNSIFGIRPPHWHAFKIGEITFEQLRDRLIAQVDHGAARLREFTS